MIHLIIWVSSLSVLIFYLNINPDLLFFSDSAIKWRQLLEFSKGQFSCDYPGLFLDPERLYIPSRFYIQFQGNCHYLFSKGTPILFIPLFKLFGNLGIFLSQFLFVLGIQYSILNLGKKLNLNNSNLIFTIIFWTFGTGCILALGDLEDHIASAFLFLISIQCMVFSENKFIFILGGILFPLIVLLRPEMIILSVIFPVAFYYFEKSKLSLDTYYPTKRWYLILILFVITYSLVILYNYNLSGKPLGFKQYDPTNHYNDMINRFVNLNKYLFFNWPFLSNALFFHMPSLLLIIYLFFNKDIEKENRRLINFFLIISISILPISFISPLLFGGPYLGIRFISFLYPFLCILVFKSKEIIEQKFPGKIFKLVFLVLISFTLLQTFILVKIGYSVFRHYKNTYEDLKKVPGSILVIRDDYLESSLYDEYYRRPIFLTRTEEECKTIIQKILKNKIKDFSIVESHSNPNKSLNCSEEKESKLVKTNHIKYSYFNGLN